MNVEFEGDIIDFFIFKSVIILFGNELCLICNYKFKVYFGND